MQASLLQIRTVAGAIERNLALLAATLSANAAMHGWAKALFFPVFANRAAQKASPATLWHAGVVGFGSGHAIKKSPSGAGFGTQTAKKAIIYGLSRFPNEQKPTKFSENAGFHSVNAITIGDIAGKFNVPFRGGFMATGLTKTQLVRHLAEKLELNNKQAAAFLEQLADVAIKETKKNGVFVVPGIGRLVKAHRKARVGRNPQTGEPIQIKAKTVVKFRVAKAAKDAIAPKK
jgi:DNA-binding protein HU-beta